MKRPLLSALLLFAGVALFLSGAWYGRHHASPSATQSQKRILYYVDPMNPAHTSAKPGLAPCGMKMEPVYASDEPGTANSAPSVAMAPGTVRLSAEKQQLIGIQLGHVESMPATNTLRLLGRVAPDDRRVYRLNAGVDGIVREVSTVTTGSRVKKGQWLATFSAPNARASMQGFLTAVDVLERQKDSGQNASGPMNVLKENVRVAADRLEGLGLSSLQIEEIRKTHEVPVALRILAPAAGVVLAQGATPGLTFEKGAEWYRIADLSHVWVLADVAAQDAKCFQPGATAHVSLPGCRKSLEARVSDALPQFDPGTRTLKVRFEVENPEDLLRPEMLVDVVLAVPEVPTLAVSAEAVLDSGLSSTVFVAREQGVFEPRTVETGRRLAGRVEVLSGLEPGEQVVVAGNFLLDSESRMKLAAAGAPEKGQKDPVCHMTVDEQEARNEKQTSDYQGRTYYFCNAACKQRFEKAPGRFIQNTALARASAHEEQHASAMVAK